MSGISAKTHLTHSQSPSQGSSSPQHLKIQLRHYCYWSRFADKDRIAAGVHAGRCRAAVCCVIQLSSSDPTDAASSTPGNSLFTKALPLCAFGVVTLRFDFLLFKEVCYCHQGLYLITERHQREMQHSGESLEGAFWRKLASSLGWEWLLKFPFLCRAGYFFWAFFRSLSFDFLCAVSLCAGENTSCSWKVAPAFQRDVAAIYCVV